MIVEGESNAELLLEAIAEAATRLRVKHQLPPRFPSATEHGRDNPQMPRRGAVEFGCCHNCNHRNLNPRLPALDDQGGSGFRISLLDWFHFKEDRFWVNFGFRMSGPLQFLVIEPVYSRSRKVFYGWYNMNWVNENSSSLFYQG
jgi:hypothetical protein